MQPRLLACLMGSMLVGAMAAGLALAAGWSWLAAVGIYGLGGSAVLVGLSLVVLALTGGEAQDFRRAEPLPPECPGVTVQAIVSWSALADPSRLT